MNKIYHPTLGNIEIQVNVRARRVTMRVRNGVIRATVPVGMSGEELLAVLTEHEVSLCELLRKAASKSPLTLGYESKTNGLTVRIVEHDQRSTLIRYRDNTLSIVCPRGSDYDSPELRDLIRIGMERGLKYYGKHYLSMRVLALATKHSIRIREVKVTGSKGKWGSCNSKRVINLSCYSLLLPDHLLDYLILHELSHTFEMNHSERFYAKLNQLCDGQHEVLGMELKKQRMPF